MNIKQSFRSIFRNKTYNLLNIFGLAVGIASAALILLWVEDEVNYDRIYPDSDDLYVLGHTETPVDVTNTYMNVSHPTAVAVASDFPGIQKVTRLSGERSIFSADGITGFKEPGYYVDSTFFSMFGVKMRGNPGTAFASQSSVVISDKLAEKLFGKEDPIGKNVKMDDVEMYITGVFQNLPGNSSFQREWLRPFDELVQARRDAGGSAGIDNWFSHWLNVYVKLYPTVHATEVNANLSALLKREKPDDASHYSIFAYPLKNMRLYGEFVDGKPTGNGYIRTIRLFTAIACIILFIACINFMNLSTARSEKRALEVGVCKTFGAKRFGLVSQFMRESGIITLISLLVAILIIWISLPAFGHMVEKQLSLHLLKPSHIAGLLGIGLVCTFLAGSYPSFYLSSFNPITTLKKMKIQPGGSVLWIRKGLVVFQFAVAFILICATTVVYLQIKHAHNRSLGYDKEQVVMIETGPKINASIRTIRQELQNTGYVVNSGLSRGSILRSSSHGWGFGWKGKPEHVNPILTRMYTAPGYVETMGLHLLEGRDFSEENEADKDRVIIDRRLADLMGEEGRAGGMINDREIVGIVDNFVFDDIYKTNNEPVIIFHAPGAANVLNVRIKSGVDVQQAINSIEAVMKPFIGVDPFVYAFMDEVFDSMFRAQQREGTLAGLFSILAIFISCLGLFGLSAFSAEQRTKEIGIRKVLGASVFGLSRMLVNNFLVLIGISLIVGTPIAWYATHRWLSEYEYRIDENWLVFVFAGLLVTLIAILTVSFQSLKAATANPVKSIKME